MSSTVKPSVRANTIREERTDYEEVIESRPERVFHVGRRCLALNRTQSREDTVAGPEKEMRHRLCTVGTPDASPSDDSFREPCD